MKKAKLMLTAIGVLAIIGGALAFKANHRNGAYYCTNTTSTLDPLGRTVTCSITATTGLAAPVLGRCTLTPTTGTACGLITRWSTNQ